MATHDYIISNASGASVRADLNNALAAIVSNNSNATSPATTYAFQFWADTTTGQLKIRNAANSAWITLMELDGTMLMEDGTVSAPGLAFASDTNTGFFRSAADKINFATGGAERLEIGSSEVVFNDPSNDVDFRVESNGKTHMLFVDAGNDAVVIGGNSALTSDTQLTLTSTTTSGGLGILSPNNGRGDIFFGDAADDNIGQIKYSHSNDSLTFRTNASDAVVIDSSGRLLVGTSSSVGDDNNLQIVGSTADASAATFWRSSSDFGNPSINFVKTRGSVASPSIVSSGDTLGHIRFSGHDGVDHDNRAAEIKAQVDGTPGSNDMPGRLILATTADGASSPTERLRIDSSGNIGMTTAGFFGFNGVGDETHSIQYDSGIDGVEIRGQNGIKFATGSGSGTERMRIDSSGNVGIGTTSPSRLLTIQSTGNANFCIKSANTGVSQCMFGDTDSDVSGNIAYRHSDNAMAFEVNGSERMRIDSSGNVGINVSSISSSRKVEIQQPASYSAALRIKAESSGNNGDIEWFSGLSQYGIGVTHGTDALKFRRDSSEVMRIDSSGRFFVGKSATGNDVRGLVFQDPTSTAAYLSVCNDTNSSGARVILVNRQSSDGTLIDFRQANTSEGAISVSGSTVSLIGGHLSRWSQTLTLAEHTDLLRGTVLTNLDEMCEWRTSDGELEDNEQLNKMAVSSVEGDPNVAGVLVTIDDDNDLDVAMTGDFIIRIAQGTTVARGDLLMSAGDGTAKPQDDDIVRPKTIAKVTSTTVSTTY